MKLFLLNTAALIAGRVTAQFFVLYGKDTVVERADPILSPGTVAQHVHDFAGSESISPSSNYPSLRNGKCSSMGAANGSSINEDRSIYWHPSLYVKANNGSYVRVPIIGRQIYYKNIGIGTMRDPFEFPKGFRMIAGTNTQRVPLPHTPTNYDNITQWICHAPVWNQGTYGGFPTGVTSCPNYPFFNGAIHFPHCWNGNAYNASAPNAHMSYPTGDMQAGPCPASHPIRLPHIFMENDFYLENMKGEFQIDTFALSNGDPTGYGWHADFFNGWTPGTLPVLLNGTDPCFSEDVGTCNGATFDAEYPTASCTAEMSLVENVDGPLPALPGCNPIVSSNPAPDGSPCALGVVGGKAADAVQSLSSASNQIRSFSSTVSSIVAPSRMTSTSKTTRSFISLSSKSTKKPSTSTEKPSSKTTKKTFNQGLTSLPTYMTKTITVTHIRIRTSTVTVSVPRSKKTTSLKKKKKRKTSRTKVFKKVKTTKIITK